MASKVTSLRNWHVWVGILSAIPILIIAISTVFLVHKKLDFRINLPSFNLKPAPIDLGLSDLRSFLITDKGDVWVANRSQLHVFDTAGNVYPITQMGQVRDLHLTADNSVLVAGKNGLWRVKAGSSPTRVLNEEVRSITAGQYGITVANKRGWWLGDSTGQHWQQGEMLNKNEIRAVLALNDNETWFAEKLGVYVEKDGERSEIDGLTRLKVRDLQQQADGSILILADREVLLWQNHTLKRVLSHNDLTSISASRNQVFATADSELWISDEKGQRWSAWTPSVQIQKSLQRIGHEKNIAKNKRKSIEIRKVMKSLHTGKFLGRYDWLWADLISASLVLFVMSGVWLWWKARRRELKQIRQIT